MLRSELIPKGGRLLRSRQLPGVLLVAIAATGSAQSMPIRLAGHMERVLQDRKAPGFFATVMAGEEGSGV